MSQSEGFALTGYDIPGCVDDGAWMLWGNSSVAVAPRPFLDICWTFLPKHVFSRLGSIWKMGSSSDRQNSSRGNTFFIYFHIRKQRFFGRSAFHFHIKKPTRPHTTSHPIQRTHAHTHKHGSTAHAEACLSKGQKEEKLRLRPRPPMTGALRRQQK